MLISRTRDTDSDLVSETLVPFLGQACMFLFFASLRFLRAIIHLTSGHAKARRRRVDLGQRCHLTPFCRRGVANQTKPPDPLKPHTQRVCTHSYIYAVHTYTGSRGLLRSDTYALSGSEFVVWFFCAMFLFFSFLCRTEGRGGRHFGVVGTVEPLIKLDPDRMHFPSL